MIRTITILSFVTILLGCGPQTGQSANSDSVQQSGEYKDLGPAEMADKMKSEPGTILDVRTPQETAEGVIEGAVLMDFYEDDFAQSFQKLDKEKPVYVYCAKGGRSSNAAEMMVEAGFVKVYNLDGGMSAWKEAEMPTNTPK